MAWTLLFSRQAGMQQRHRRCLLVAGQPQGPPLRLATDQEVLQHLWTGERSVAGRMLRCAAGLLSAAPTARALAAATSQSQLQALLQQHSPNHPHLLRIADVMLAPVATSQVRVALLYLQRLGCNFATSRFASIVQAFR